MNIITLESKVSEEKFLLGLSTTQTQLLPWLHHHYSHPYTLTTLQDSTHLRSLQAGFQLEFKAAKVQTVFLYFRTPKISCFKGPVRLAIHEGWTIKAAVTYLGEPPIKNKMMEIIYPHLGLGLVFRGSWSDEASAIEYCYWFEGEEREFCGGCGKGMERAFWECGCGWVSYCSQVCKKKHYGQHLIFCEEDAKL